MKQEISNIPVSVLDLATIIEGDSSPAEAFARSVTMAKHAEANGYKRYWFAEHHNMESVPNCSAILNL